MTHILYLIMSCWFAYLAGTAFRKKEWQWMAVWLAFTGAVIVLSLPPE